MSKKAQTWKLMENLRSERILNGVENLDSLSASLSQSLWSLSNKIGDHDLSQRSSTPSLQQHQQSAVSKTNDHSARTLGAKAKRSKYKNFRSMTGAVDFSNSMALQRTTSLGGIFQGKPSKPSSISGQNGNLSNSQLLEHYRSTHAVGGLRGSGGSHGYMPSLDKVSMCDPVHDHRVQRSPVSDLSSTEGSETNLWDDSGMGMKNRKGMRNGYLGSTQKSATLPRQSRPKYSDLPLSKSSSHSPVNLNEPLYFGDSNTSINSQSLPDSGNNPLSSLLRVFPTQKSNMKILPLSRTRSHGEVEEARSRDHLLTPSPTPSANVSISTSQPLEEKQEESPPNRFTRKKCHSVGSLDAPDVTQLIQPPNKNGYRKSLPCSMEPNKTLSDSLTRPLSSSEGCLWNPTSSDSYFNVLYIRDSYSRSQKPNVETVDEEEEGLTKTKNESLEEGEEADVSMASSSCTEVPLHKSSDDLDTETEHVQSSDYAGAENDNNKKNKSSPGSNTDSGVEESTDSEKTQFSDFDKKPTHKSLVPVLELFPEITGLSICEKESNQPNRRSIRESGSSHIKSRRSIRSESHYNREGQGAPNVKVFEEVSVSENSNMEVKTPKEHDSSGNSERNLLIEPKCISKSPETIKRHHESDRKDCSKVSRNSREDAPLDKSKFLFIIPEMAVSDVDSFEPEAMTPLSRARYFFKDMKEISSLSETDSDLDDLTPKEKFTLLHEWSISVESDDMCSPTSVDEQKFNIDVGNRNDVEKHVYETPTASQDSGRETPSKEILLQTSERPSVSNLVLPVSSTSGSSSCVDAPINQVDKYAAYSPLMKRKQHIPASSSGTNEADKLRRPQSEGELNSKSKVRQLSEMFEVKHQTTGTSVGKGREDIRKMDTVKRGSPRIRSKVESTGGAEPTKSRKESVSRIPVAGDKKKSRSVQSRKENFSKSPEPCTLAADKLLPSKPTFRNRHVQATERNTKHGQVADWGSKHSKSVARASSAPQPKIKIKPSSIQETSSAMDSNKEYKQDKTSRPHRTLRPKRSTAETLFNPAEDSSEVGRQADLNDTEVPTAVCETRDLSIIEDSKPKHISQEIKAKNSSHELKTRTTTLHPEPKPKPNSHHYRGMESKSKTSNPVSKSSPTRTREPKIKNSGLHEPTRRLGNAPEPKPKPKIGYSSRTKAASPQWEVLGRTRPGAKSPSTKSPAGSPNLQRLNGNRFYNKQSAMSNSARGAIDVHSGDNSSAVEETNNSLQVIHDTTALH